MCWICSGVRPIFFLQLQSHVLPPKCQLEIDECSLQILSLIYYSEARGVLRMSLQELAALETQQAIESANYENADVTYAVINEGDLLQVRIASCINPVFV